MTEDTHSFMETPVLTTPRPTACSTVNRRQAQKNKPQSEEELDQSSSIGILSFQSSNLSDYAIKPNTNKSEHNITNHLEQQRSLAESTLQRATKSKTSGLPSKYFKPKPELRESTCNFSIESTINESDLLRTPCNNSTPRSSILTEMSSGRPRPSIGDQIAQLSEQVRNPSVSLFGNWMDEVHKALSDVNPTPERERSSMFIPAEEARSKLLADELSWRREHEMPQSQNELSLKGHSSSQFQVSMGEFFKQKSNNISDFNVARSPEKRSQPVPLIDNTLNSTGKDASLSVSAIAKFLENTEYTPGRVANYLMSQAKQADLNESIEEAVSLPVSENSSYTSNYSENEALQHCVNKENIDISNFQSAIKIPQSKSRSPVRSSSAVSSSSCLTSLTNGKLPIESTKCELIWGCVKVDKCVTQEFILRNKCAKSLRIQLSLSGYQFKIRKDTRPESDPLSAAKIFLHAHESRPVIISFIPTKIGAAIDELEFKALDSQLQQTKRQVIRLFGYGGYSNVEIHNVTKDLSNKFWLSLGMLNNSAELRQTFVVKNTGNLAAFTCISFISKELCTFSSVKISCSFFVLVPQEQKEIEIVYHPSVEDYRRMQNYSSILELGALKIISGSEVNRGRLRRLCRKAIEINGQLDPLSCALKERIRGEAMPNDVAGFKESSGALREILNLFNNNEIIVTLEQDPEQTLMPQYPDDSAMFQSLCQDNNVTAFEHGESKSPVTCKIEPSDIILSVPTKVEDIIFVKSECGKVLHYEAKSVPDGLEIYPRVGKLLPNDMALLKVKCPKFIKERSVFKVLVYVENEVLETVVKVVFIKDF